MPLDRGLLVTSRELKQKDNNSKKELKKYFKVAEQLIITGHYNWLVSVIADCYETKSTFIVIDCPSGTGKTQAGIALMLLSSSNYEILEGKRLIYAHIVWDSAVSSQPIYSAIQRQQAAQKILVEIFFYHANVWLQTTRPKPDEISAYKNNVWENFLAYIYNDSLRGLFFGDGIFVMGWDEIPTEPKHLAFIGELRDALKVVENIVIILSGTNSKAANMICITTGDASSSATIKPTDDEWSFLITRLPMFFPELAEEWSNFRDLSGGSALNADQKSALKAIQTTIEMNGNPRLINMAISAFVSLSRKTDSFTFCGWQERLSTLNLESKFTVRRWSCGSDILKSQCNLLMAASSSPSLADAAIHRHYGQRAFPDNGATPCCCLGPSKADQLCGGWLKLCPSSWRSRGKALYFGQKAPADITLGDLDWQISVFPPFERDVLVYLASCWRDGYFAVYRRDFDDVSQFSPEAGPKCVFTASEVVSTFWEENVMGGLNFQNIQSPVNTGSYVEVLVVLAVMNAAAVSRSATSDFLSFFFNFLKQLGSKCLALSTVMVQDKAFDGLRVPRFVFPGAKCNVDLIDGVGILRRTKKEEKIDAALYGIRGENGLKISVDKIHLESKQRKRMDSKKVLEVIPKLLKGKGDIGIMCLTNSSQFVLQECGPSGPLLHLAKGVEELGEGCNLGIGYFVSKDGVMSSYKFSEKPGRFILITIPDS